jgi:luciferase family oxidoreductase group 1
VVAAALGQATTRLRVGTGGILLLNHPSLVAAEQLSTLEALFPGRVDFGIGRASSDIKVVSTLGAKSGDDFPQEVADLLGYLGADSTAGQRYKGLIAAPGLVGRPAVWLLGSSTFSASLAARLGMPFAFGHHFRPEGTIAGLETYRREFRPSAILDRPYALVALQTICGADDAEAEYLAGPLVLSFLRMLSAPPERLPTFEEAAAFPWEGRAQEVRRHVLGSQAIGSQDTVRARLADILDRTGADELMLTTMVPDGKQARTSMTRVRELFGTPQLPTGLGLDTPHNAPAGH